MPFGNNDNDLKEAILPVAGKKSFFSQLSEDIWAILIGAQAFNILGTLLWAYLLFGGILFPAPDIK